MLGYIQSPIGWLRLVLNEKRQLMRINLNVPPPSEDKTSSLFEDICAQLTEYFAGRRKIFTLPLCLEGTPFEIRVAKALSNIPYGETRSYKDIATVCGNSEATRAVGQAVHRNKLPIVVPCHRIIGASGSLVGYADGLAIKQFLLRLEGACKDKEGLFG